MTMTVGEVKQALISLLPPRLVEWMDFEEGGDFDLWYEAMAEELLADGVEQVEALTPEMSPWTSTATGIAAWEAALGLSQTRTAVAGSIEQRRAQVISHLRARGTPTKALIRRVVAPLLGYSDPSQLEIIECDRSALTTLHTYTNSDGAVMATDTSESQTVTVLDDPAVSKGGIQLSITVITTRPEDLRVVVFGPSTSGDYPDAVVDFPVGTMRGGGDNGVDPVTYVLRSPDAAGCDIFGEWRMQLTTGTDVGCELVEWSLFVEAVGRPSTGTGEGRGAEVFLWGAYADPALVGGNGTDPDYAAALAAIKRITPAHCVGHLICRTDGIPRSAGNGRRLLPGQFIPHYAP